MVQFWKSMKSGKCKAIRFLRKWIESLPVALWRLWSPSSSERLNSPICCVNWELFRNISEICDFFEIEKETFEKRWCLKVNVGYLKMEMIFLKIIGRWRFTFEKMELGENCSIDAWGNFLTLLRKRKNS